MAMTATATFRTTPELKSRMDFLAKETHRPTSFFCLKTILKIWRTSIFLKKS